MKRRTKMWNRFALAVAVWLAMILVAACAQPAAETGAESGAEAQPSEAGSLAVLEWAGYELPEFWSKFAEAHPDVEVDNTFFEQEPDVFAKVQSGFPVDAIHPCVSWWGFYVEEGLVQPIDTSRLKNWPDLEPKLAKLGEFNGQQYFIPWDWGYESIVVRTDKVDKIPTSWADLWDPAYAGRLAVPDNAEMSQVMAALALGVPNPWDTTPEEDELIKQKLMELKPNVLTYWADSTELAQMMASGDVWVAAGVWTATYQQLLSDGIPVEYINPTEGRAGWVCGYGITAHAESPDLALEYIDARLDAESSANLSNEYYYGTSNSKSIEMIDPEVVKLFDMDRPEVLDQTAFYRPMTAEHRQKVIEMWDEVRLAP